MPLRRHLAEDAEHWRLRAEQARAIAGALSDSVARKKMLDVAISYDRIADRAHLKTGTQPDAAEKAGIGR